MAQLGGQVILPVVLGRNNRNLNRLEKKLDLANWLRKNDPELHTELYRGSDVAALAQLREASKTFDVPELQRHAERISNSVNSDASAAIGSGKELLETVFRTILNEHGAQPAGDLPELFGRTRAKLGLDPRQIDKSIPGAESVLRVIGSLGQLVNGVAEVRNIFGTGHGRSRAPALQAAQARLVVSSAVAVGTFLLEVWEAQGRP